jgi:hypothetical protein
MLGNLWRLLPVLGLAAVAFSVAKGDSSSGPLLSPQDLALVQGSELATLTSSTTARCTLDNQSYSCNQTASCFSANPRNNPPCGNGNCMNACSVNTNQRNRQISGTSYVSINYVVGNPTACGVVRNGYTCQLDATRTACNCAGNFQDTVDQCGPPPVIGSSRVCR